MESHENIPAPESDVLASSSNPSHNPDRDTDSFLLEEYKHISALFRQNEEAGERRITFLLTLVTAVSAGLVALLTNKDKCFTADHINSIANGALMALLVLGVVTLRRVYKRNKTSDFYKKGMDIIREQFTGLDARLKGYTPFKKKQGTIAFLERQRFLNGGLVTIVAILNSAFIAALCAINADRISLPVWLLCPIGFGSSLLIQFMFVEYDNLSTRSDAQNNSKKTS